MTEHDLEAMLQRARALAEQHLFDDGDSGEMALLLSRLVAEVGVWRNAGKQALTARARARAQVRARDELFEHVRDELVRFVDRYPSADRAHLPIAHHLDLRDGDPLPEPRPSERPTGPPPPVAPRSARPDDAGPTGDDADVDLEREARFDAIRARFGPELEGGSHER